MAKYVCDFDTVRTNARAIVTAADEMTKSMTAYSTNVSDHLSGWKDGTSAKDAFTSTNEEQVTITNSHISEIDEVGNFILKACAAIASLEEQLGGMQI